jgi:putative transposase
MRAIGLTAIYRRPRTSKLAPGHKVYPYLLRGMEITRPNQVWAADITYIPMAKGFFYLVAVMDWYSRYVVAWSLSNTLDANFCVEALEEALSKGKPEVFNTDQGSQFTSDGFTGLLVSHGVRISMDGKGRYMDNIFVERLWRTVKYEEVYLKAYSSGRAANDGFDAYFRFYNTERPHQALGYRTPAEVFNEDSAPSEDQLIDRNWSPSGALVNLGNTAGLSLNITPILSN